MKAKKFQISQKAKYSFCIVNKWYGKAPVQTFYSTEDSGIPRINSDFQKFRGKFQFFREFSNEDEIPNLILQIVNFDKK